MDQLGEKLQEGRASPPAPVPAPATNTLCIRHRPFVTGRTLSNVPGRCKDAGDAAAGLSEELTAR